MIIWQRRKYFRLLSEKNLTSKNILTITPRELNFTRLRNWAMMMDPTQKDDPYAKRIYVQSCCNILFLENKKAEFTQTLEELENKIDHLQQDAQRQGYCSEKERLTEQFRKVLGGTDVAEFASALTVAHAAQEQAPVLRSMDVPKDLAISLGICARALPIPEEIRYVARGIFGENYDAKNSLRLFACGISGRRGADHFRILRICKSKTAVYRCSEVSVKPACQSESGRKEDLCAG